MAGRALSRLEEQLKCIVCLDTYTDPKLLQCSHAYCTKCILKLVIRDQQGQLTLTCPTCRQVTPIPPNGVRELQSAFRINELIEIRDDLKQAENQVPEVENDETQETILTHYCSEHVEEELKLYCQTCSKLICVSCGLRDGTHHSHDYNRLNVAVENYKGEITSSLKSLENQLKIIQTALAELDSRSEEITNQQEIVEESIHDTIKQVHETLDVRKTELIGQLHQMTQKKLKVITLQKDKVETIQAQLNSCSDIIDGSLTSSQGEIMNMKATTVKQIKELTTPFPPDLLKVNMEADITFSPSSDVIVQCKKYGKILLGSPDCHATGTGLEVAVVGMKSLILLQASGSSWKKSLQCELVSDITLATARGNLERRGLSQYQISYKPTVKGRHQLHIRVEDQHIKGSPFTVVVTSPVEKLRTPILTIGGVKEPRGIAFNHRGEVVVGEWGGYCVSTFSPSGEKIGTSSTLNSPYGIAVDGEGNILVADTLNNCIQKLTTKGASNRSEGTEFLLPHGITYNYINNNVYVVDDHHQVTILNSDLAFSSSFGKKGSGKGEFNEPYDIACDTTGNVYVADSENHRIQVFTAVGKFLRMFGRCCHERGELHIPISITIDTCNRVYVGDSNDRVSIFTSDGHFIASFGKKGEGPGEFKCPSGLAVNADGVVYVCDRFNYRIQLF